MVISCEPPCIWTVRVLYTKTREQIFIRLYLASTPPWKGVRKERFPKVSRGSLIEQGEAARRKTFSKDNRGGFEEKKRKKRRVAEETCKSSPPPPRCQLNVVYRGYCLAGEKYSSRIRWRLCRRDFNDYFLTIILLFVYLRMIEDFKDCERRIRK